MKKKKITRVERETNTNEDISFLTKSEARYICAFTSAIDQVVKSKQQTVKRNAYLDTSSKPVDFVQVSIYY